MDKDKLAIELAEIGAKIEKAKTKLEHHGIFSKGHQLTQAELNTRFRYLENELDSEVSSLSTNHKHVNELEKSLLSWLNGIDFENN